MSPVHNSQEVTCKMPHVPHIMFRLLCFAVLFACFNSGVWAEPHLRTVHADAGSLIVEFKLPDPQFSDKDSGGRTFSQISFKGADFTMKIGQPRLPIYSQLIGIPIGVLPQANIINAQSEVRPTKIVMPAQPDPILGSGNSQPQKTASAIMDSDFYRQDSLYPTHAVEITPVGFIREQRVARLEIRPIQYNPRKSQLKIHHELQIRIDFNQPTAAPSQLFSTYNPSQPFEKLFQTNLLNYGQAKGWRQIPRPQPQTAAAPAQAEVEERYKLLITRTGMYRITYNQIQAAGADASQMDLETIKIENDGRTVGVYISDKAEDGKFDREDSIVFYGRELIGNKFTDTNVYWLSWNSPGNSRVDTKDAEPKTPDALIPLAFMKTERFEQALLHDSLDGDDIRSELADHYFWISLKGRDSKRFPIEVPGAIPRLLIHRLAKIRLKLQGASLFNHKATILFNGRQLGVAEEWKRQATVLLSRDIEQRQFIHHDASNSLTVVAKAQSNLPANDIDFYVDWFELDYWHAFGASAGALEFNSNTEPEPVGTVQYRVENLRRREIDVYQIRDGSVVAKLVNGEIEEAAAAKFHITFEDKTTQPSSYFVVDELAYKSSRLLPATPSILRSPANQADYIVIAHKDFIDGIQPLVELRRSQGLSVIVADIEQVYDQFNHGVFSPFAIREFLRYAYTSWQQPAPTYVLLVGDAHYDYKNAIVELYRRDGSTYDLYPIYVPTFHGWAPVSGETAMDHRFVTISGDDTLPDMFIGRLSIQLPRELDTMVRKLIDYEQKPKIGPWQRTLIQVADDEKSNSIDWIFEESRNTIVDEFIPVAYDTREIYLRQIISPERTKQLIVDTLHEGALILEYAGHGGADTWADEAILRIESVPGFRNQHLPFIITTTCLNGQFDKPLRFGQRSLSEELMMGRYGAIGTLSATRLTFATANAAFDEDLFDSMFSVKPSTLGAIIGNAKIKFIASAVDSGRSSWVPGAEQYTLFGDPATRLALPDLEIKVELDEIALNANKQLVIQQNVVGHYQISPATGEIEFRKAIDFSTETMSAAVLFANNFDENQINDLSRRRDRIKVWKGDFGDIHFRVPGSATAGRGIVRLFASDGQHTAIGGTEFWTDLPIIYDLREDLDAKVTDTLNISVQIVDDAGPAGIKSVDVVWNNTVDYKGQTTPMAAHPQPPTPVVNGGQWWRLQTPIPLPKGGRSVLYQIVVTDNADHVVFFPSEKGRQNVKVPEGANIAIAPNILSVVPIRYGYSENTNRPTLMVDLVNDGGKDISVDIDVWFSEGNPDENMNHQIDPDANVLGKVLVRASEWEPDDTTLQKVTAALALDEPLSRGTHQIYVFADPESPEHNPDDKIIGALDEPRSVDNKDFRSFVVNEFALKPNEELTAFSFDRVFDAFFPIDSLQPTTLSVDSLEPLTSFQPDLEFVPIPRAAALRSGLISLGAEAAQVYKIKLHSNTIQLAKPAEIKLRFDNTMSKDNAQQQGDTNVLHADESKIAIYAWKEQIGAWKRLPSEVLYQEDGDLLQERYLTSTQTENTNTQELRASMIRVDPALTPTGEWIIFFVDSDNYEVLLQRRGSIAIEKSGELGELDIAFRDEIFGIELEIERTDTLGGSQPFEFGDILTFETNLDRNGNVTVSEIGNSNRGSGVANVNLGIGPEDEFESGDWLIFFRNRGTFEIRDSSNTPIADANRDIVLGSVNEPLFIDNLGVEVLVTSGDEPFAFGDKIKFSTTTVGVVSAEVTELTPFALMASSDADSPKLQLWVNGEPPEPRSVIPPRPEISLFLEDSNGIDMDTFRFAVSKNEGPFEEIAEFNITSQGQITTIPIFYKPILFIGRYLYRIWVTDLNGNELGGEGGFSEFQFFVEEPPDLEPPEIEIRINNEMLIDGTILGGQPQIEVQITDDHGIEPATIQFSFGIANEPLVSLPREEYSLQFDETQPKQAVIGFAPDLPNDEYQVQISAGDTSENVYEGETFHFQVDEVVDIADVLNVPNPMRTNTFFTYNFVQAPEHVTIKIYTVTGRLVRTILDASARRGYNETYWDGRDENDVRLANGTYFYRVTVEADERQIDRTGRLAILR